MTSQNDVMPRNNYIWKKEATHDSYVTNVNSTHGYQPTAVTKYCNIAPISRKTGQSCAKRNETAKKTAKKHNHPYNW